jgi:hypothetical protein
VRICGCSPSFLAPSDLGGDSDVPIIQRIFAPASGTPEQQRCRLRRIAITAIPICGARLVDGGECACEAAKCDCALSDVVGVGPGARALCLCVLHVREMHRCIPIGGGPFSVSKSPADGA